MKKITLSAKTMNIITFLAVLVALLWEVNYYIANYALVVADSIQGKIPSTEGLLQWATIR